MTQPRKTPLHDLHVELGAKIVDFAGWSMPVSYPAGIMAEHKQCREKAALFDVSHMAQVNLRGDDPATALESICPSAFTTLKEGKARYTVFTNATGGIMDDLIVSNAGDHLFVVVNASMRDQDLAHMRGGMATVEVEEITDRGLIALQGPAAESVMAALAPAAAELTFMQTAEMDVNGARCRVSRLGYTGEDGYEISVPEAAAEALARKLLEHDDVEPAGLGARDSLRMEAGLCLYGNDIDAHTSPVEAQIQWLMQKRRREEGGFPGAERIMAELKDGPARKLVGIRPEGRAPARAGVTVQDAEGAEIGAVTSGGFGPTVGGPISMGYVDSAHAEPGTDVSLMIRGKAHPAKIAAMPFVTQNYKR